MRRRHAAAVFALSFAGAMSLVLPSTAGAFTADEHSELAARVWSSVLEEIGATEAQGDLRLPLGEGAFLALPEDLLEGETWPDVVQALAANDRESARFHRFLQTTQQQLSRVRAIDLRELMTERVVAGKAPSSVEEVESAANPSLGTVANFFLHHWLALQFARRAAAGGEPGASDPGAPSSEEMRHALVYEAMAQGYLLDAFSASHMLVPDRNWLSWLHPWNTRHVHDVHRDSGAYVIDSRHRVWLCFGDGVLFWYPFALERANEACRISLLEVFACFYEGLGSETGPPRLREWLLEQYPDGDAAEKVEAWSEPSDASVQYAELRMPSLLSLPWPIAATWSVTSDEEIQPSGVEPRVLARKHYPQLREAGLHDSTLIQRDRRDLHSLSAVPAWMVLPALPPGRSPAMDSSSSEVASVRWWCERHLEPTFVGALLIPGIGYRVRSGADAWISNAGIGYGVLDEELRLRWLPNIQRVSLEGRWSAGTDRAGDAITAVAAAQLWFPTRADLHAELGYAFGIERPLRRHGPTVGLGVTLGMFDLPYVYLGSLLRARWEVMYLDEITGGPVLEIVVH